MLSKAKCNIKCLLYGLYSMAVCNFFSLLFGAEYVLVGSVLRKQYVGNDLIFPIALPCGK